jgi:kumamolisin
MARTVLAGHDRRRPDHPAVDVPVAGTLQVSLYLRPGRPLPSDTVRMTREAYAAHVAPTAADLRAVRRFASAARLTVTGTDPARRYVGVTGTADDVAAAFGTRLAYHDAETGFRYRAYSGPLTAPEEVAPILVGVFGLDNRVERHRRQPALSFTGVSLYSPLQVAAAYGITGIGSAAGQTIAIVGNIGYSPADMTTYFTYLGVPVPTITPVSLSGVNNNPATPDTETTQDIQIAAAMAPGAAIAVYFSGASTVDTFSAIVHDTVHHPDVISASVTQPEFETTAAEAAEVENVFLAAATIGVTVCVASGDNGATGDSASSFGVYPDGFPSTCPHALSCGGTNLTINGSQIGSAISAPYSITSEVVWNTAPYASSGGFSTLFSLPAWQASSGISLAGRGYPDVAAMAAQGYDVCLNGGADEGTGTSAAAPAWAALIACINAYCGFDVGFVNPALYALGTTPPSGGTVYHDITSGNNTLPNGFLAAGYTAGTGWDACTGWGSPQGTRLADALLQVGPPTLYGLSYQWNRNGTDIANGTAQTYTLAALDAGASITVTVTDTNAFGFAAATSTAVTIAGTPPVPVITAFSPPNGVHNVAYPGYQFVATNSGNGWSTGGNLPPGLFVLNSGGALGGTPSTAGTYTFTVSCFNSAGPSAPASVTMTIT